MSLSRRCGVNISKTVNWQNKSDTIITELDNTELSEEIPNELGFRFGYNLDSKSEQLEAENVSKKSFLYEELKPLLVLYRILGQLPITISSAGEAVFSYVSIVSLYSIVVYIVVVTISVFVTILLLSPSVTYNSFQEGIGQYEYLLLLLGAYLSPLTILNDGRSTASYLNHWTEFAVSYKKCTRQELYLGLRRTCWIVSVFTGCQAVFQGVSFMLGKAFSQMTIIHMIPYNVTASVETSSFGLWCIHCTALSRAGRALADHFKEDLQGAMTPLDLHEYRMTWRKLSALCRELGRSMLIMFWVDCVLCFVGFTLSAFSAIYCLRHLLLDYTTGFSCLALCYGVILFFMCDFAHRVPTAVTTDILRELQKITPSSVKEDYWREVETLIRTIETTSSNIHMGGFTNINRKLYVSISNMSTYSSLEYIARE